MKFDILKKSHKKSIVIGVSLFIILSIVLIARFTFAKYSLVKSIKIAEGTINYKVPDFKMMAMYKNDGDGDVAIETMPESGYTINESKSYCTLDNINKDTKAKLYTDANGNHVISGLSKSDKCYLYFDKVPTAGETILANVTPKNCATSFTGVATTNEGVCTTKDDDGDTYYFRGAVTNNYVKFANMWWRIIRINGDGSIRLIYDGTSAHDNGTSTSDSIAVASQTFNASYNNNAYVGFKYTSGEVHGLGTKSNALTQLETWYTNNLASYAAKIDTNAGFCGDREPSTTMESVNGSGGTGTTATYYGAFIRMRNSSGSWNTTQTPTYKCKNSSDLYTMISSNKGNKSLSYPIGLITADEVVYAGGFGGTNNTSYYLYNGQPYWTMSPYYFSSGYAHMFGVSESGYLGFLDVRNAAYDIRPVINLKADIILKGTGTTSDPYVVS